MSTTKNLDRIYFLFDETGLKRNGVYTVREDVVCVTHNLGAGKSLKVQVLVGSGDDQQWVPLKRNGSDIVIGAGNTQFFEIHPGTYRIDPADAATLVIGADRLFFYEVANPEALLLAIAHDVAATKAPPVEGGRNVGAGAGIFSQKNAGDNTLEFKTLLGTAPIQITSGASEVTFSIAQSTTAAQGAVELATDAEAVALVDAERAITPQALKAVFDDKGLVFGGVNLGGQIPVFAQENAANVLEFNTLTATDPIEMSLAGGVITTSIKASSETQVGAVELATPAETITGTDNTRAVTPEGVKAAIEDYYWMKFNPVP